MADLLRAVTIECEMDFIKVRSYSGKKSSGTIQLIKDISADVTDRNVILVEDIIDTGHTVQFLRERFFSASPKSLSIATLLLKPLMILLSLIAIVYIALVALIQKDMKKLIC